MRFTFISWLLTAFIVSLFSTFQSMAATEMHGVMCGGEIRAADNAVVEEFMPLPAGLYEFIGYQTVKWNEMMAASLVGIVPVLLVFIFLQKYIVEGLTAGAVKN